MLAFLGYGSSCFALFLDIGLPHRIYEPIIHWNPHSFLFEVAWCVMLYFTVTIFEMAPVVLEKHGYGRLVGTLHKISIPIVIAGITFSTLHHTSLGSLFLVMPARLHELWFTSWIPVLFIFSAVGAGIQTVILMSLGYCWFYRRERNMPVLTGLAKGSAVILSIYFVFKIADLLVRGKMGLLFSGQWETGFFFTEILLSVLIPVVLIAIPSTRRSPAGLTVASLSAVLGLLLNRANVGIMGLLRTADSAYFPTLTEIALSVGVIAMAGLVLLYLVENYRIFESSPAKELRPEMEGIEEFDSIGKVWTCSLMASRARISMLVVLALPLALALFVDDALGGIHLERAPVSPPQAVDAERRVLRIDGNRDGDGVIFPHEDHQEMLRELASCRGCHHLDLPGDRSSACYPCHSDMRRSRSIFDHETHVARLGDKHACVECHDPRRPKNLENSRACIRCHRENMGLVEPERGRFNFKARSYMAAMHGRCVSCHEDEDQRVGETRLGTCAACHKKR
jgi:Ni/Fe-hydrogenase subunit HybB-like protein